MSAASVTELVVFKTLPSVQAAAFHSCAENSTRFLRTCPGFVARHLTRSEESGEWIDVVLWTDLASAEAAAQRFLSAPEAGEFMACIEPSSVQMRHGRPYFSAT